MSAYIQAISAAHKDLYKRITVPHEGTCWFMQTRRANDIDVSRRREVAARNHIDHRTLDRAIDQGVAAIRGGMTRDRARIALAELGLAPDTTNPPSAA
jgi:predicted RNA polymerase sigma factor